MASGLSPCKVGVEDLFFVICMALAGWLTAYSLKSVFAVALASKSILRFEAIVMFFSCFAL